MHDDAFLHTIHDRPDDDAPRLCYADFLDENGDPDRAEFIRLQCRLAYLSAYATGRAELESREQELLGQHQTKWLARLPALPVGWRFRRGFVDAVDLGGRAFLDHAPAIFAAAQVRHVDLSPDHYLSELAACPELLRLQSLNLRFAFTFEAADDDFHLLAELPALLRVLTEIRVVECDLGPIALRAVLDSPHLLGLRQMKLASVHLNGAEGVRAVAETAAASLLESLVFYNTPLADEGAWVLKQSQAFGRLRDLTLIDCGLGEEGARSVARSRFLANVEALDLSLNHVGNNGAWALAESPFIGGVRHLALADCHIGDAGAKGLALSPHLDRLEHLNLRCNYLTRNGRQLLRDRFGDRVDVELSKSAS